MNGMSQQMIFSPQNCMLGQLAATLSEDRRRLAEQIIARVEQTLRSGGSYKVLLVGPHGSGKTHVLHYVRKELERRHTPDTAIKAFALPEEERGIASLLDFLVSLLSAAGVSKQALTIRFRRMTALQAVEEACRVVREVTQEKPTFLVMENVSDLFDSLDSDGLSQLRGFLEGHGFISILGSSVRLLTDTPRADHPFRDYFTIHSLAELGLSQTGGYLSLLAAANNNRALAAELGRPSSKKRLKVIHDLTGGNHRSLAMLATFLTVDGLDTLVDPFIQMADRALTPYYQQWLNRLSPQQYRIVQAIAAQEGRALSVREIAQHAFLPESNVSRLLCDLRNAGLVCRRQTGRESCHELGESLLRTVLELKQGRGDRLPFVVALLRRWYEAEELRRSQVAASGLSRLYISETAEDAETEAAPANDGGLPEGERPIPDSASSASPPTDTRSTSPQTNDGGAFQAASALFNKGVALCHLERTEEGLFAFDEILHRFGTDTPPELTGLLANALMNRGDAMRNLGRGVEAISSWDQVVRRLGTSDRTAFLELVARALHSMGLLLSQIGQTAEAVRTYGEIVRRFGASNRPEIMRHVARALDSQASTLRHTGRLEEVIRTYDETIRRFGTSDHPELMERVAKALVNKGCAQAQLGRGDKAVGTFDEVVRRFGASSNPELTVKVARALMGKGLALRLLGRVEEAVSAYGELTTRFGAGDHQELTALAAMALAGKADSLRAARRYKEALALCDELLQRQPGSWEAVTVRLNILFDMGEAARALEEADEMLQCSQAAAYPERALLLALLVGRVLTHEHLLGRLRSICRTDHELVAIGLLIWLQRQLPIPKSQTQRIDGAAQSLRAAFGGTPEAKSVLDILDAAIACAKGDRRALSTLPIEIRRLIPQDNWRAVGRSR